MSGKQGIKNLLKNPLIFGTTIGLVVVFFNISVASLAEGSLKAGYEVFLDNGVFVYLVPLAVGVQMALFRHHKNITSENKLCSSEKIGITGSTASSLTMLACCLHHVSDLLPTVGFILAVSPFLTQYKDAIIIIGLLANIAGSAYITKAILKDGAAIAQAKKSTV